MKTLLHVSDLHFGRVNQRLVEPLLALAREVTPDLVVVSGDFTQRARVREYKKARDFLRLLPEPRLVVPGNHDIPLWDMVRRFLSPLGRYRRYITDDLAPFYEDEETAVLGINTARSLTRKYGRINERQIAHAREVFSRVAVGKVKIVVTHHPFDLPPGTKHRLVGRSAMAMAGLAAAGVDLILSGHLHLQHTGLTATRYRIKGYSALLAQTGTTISTRGRGEANSLNVVRVKQDAIGIEPFLWEPADQNFVASPKQEFVRGPAGWAPAC